MAQCQVKTGFLVLRDCENEALDNCSICGCYICMKHKREHPQSHKVCCIDCYAKSLDGAGEDTLDTDENHCCKCGKEVVVKAGKNNPRNKVIDPETNKVYCQDCYDHMTGDTSSMAGVGLLSQGYYDDDYWYGYRHNYYKHHHYKPLSRGHHRSTAFKDDEVRAFDPKNNPQEQGMIDDSSDKDNVFDS